MASNERERKLAREHAQRQAAQAAARRDGNQTRLIIATVVAVVAVIGGMVAVFALSHDDKSTNSAGAPASSAAASATDGGSAPASTASATAAAANGECAYSAAGSAAKDVGKPPAKAPGQDVAVTLQLTQGAVGLELTGTKAPCTVNSFTYLASKGYFDHTKCHRLTTASIYVLQCGDPTGTGSGGPGYQFPEENLTAFGGTPYGESPVTYPKGTVAMANAGKGTNGSQFFLVYQDSPLPPAYTPFGTVTTGMDILTAIADKGVEGGSGDGAPAEGVEITKASVAG